MSLFNQRTEDRNIRIPVFFEKVFDFTHLYSSQNACRVRQQRGHRLLLGLVGDSLMEPFWPEGTGIGRGFLGVLDTAWMVRRFCLEPGEQVYEVIREREKLYSLLRQTTDSRVKGHFHRWTIDPVTRWPAHPPLASSSHPGIQPPASTSTR